MSTFLRVLLLALTISPAASGQEMQMVMQTGHNSTITNLLFNKDGAQLVSTSAGVIKIWDFINRKEIKTIRIDGVINSMALLNDSLLVTSGSAGNLSLLNYHTGETIQQISLGGEILSLSYSEVRKQLAATGRFLNVLIFSFKEGKLVQVKEIPLPPSQQPYLTEYGTSVHFSVTGDSLITGAAVSKQINIYRTTDFNSAQTFRAKGTLDIRVFNKTTVATMSTKRVFLQNLNQDKYLQGLPDQSSGKFTSFDFTPDRKTILASHSMKFIYLWNERMKLQQKKFFENQISYIKAHPGQPIAVLGGNDGRIWIYNIPKQEIAEELKSYNSAVNAVSFIKNRNSIAIILGHQMRYYNFNGALKTYAVNDEIPYNTRKSVRNWITDINSISPDSLITVGIDNRLRVWNPDAADNYETKKGFRSKGMILSFPLIVGYFGSFYNLAALPYITFMMRAKAGMTFIDVNTERNLIATGGVTAKTSIFNASTLKRDHVTPFAMTTHSLKLSEEGTLFAATGSDGGLSKLKVFDYSTRREKRIYKIKEDINSLTRIQFKEGKPELFYSGASGLIHHLNFLDKKKINSFPGTGPILFGPGKDHLYYQRPDFSIVAVDPETMEEKNIFTGHTSSVKSVDFTQDKMITGSEDGTTRIWNLEDGKEVASIVSLADENFIIKTPDNYYYSSKGALKLVSFSRGLKFFPFEQFDLQYNRPDIVLQRLAMTPDELINAYRRAYYKRLKKMNFSEEVFSKDFHLPEVELAQKPHGDFTDKTMNLRITGKDSKYKLNRINVYINNVPVFGLNGIDLREENTSHTSRTVPVNLNRGKNIITVTVHNEKGVESLGETLEVNHTGPVVKPNLYVLAIGVSSYHKSAMNLNYASKDAKDVAEFLSSQKDRYNEIYIDTILNQNATTEYIVTRAAKLKETKVDDHVIVFVAGHGLLDENLDYYIGTHDVNFESPSEKGLAYEKLEELMMHIPARNKILLMDACHSGEVDKEEVVLARNTEPVDGGQIKFRAVGNKVVPKVGLENSFELMKHLFADLRRGSGTSVISSAGGAEYAMEGTQWNNGVFTYCFLSGLKNMKADLNRDGRVMLSELQIYLQKEVVNLTNGKQTPTSRAENLYNDILVW